MFRGNQSRNQKAESRNARGSSVFLLLLSAFCFLILSGCRQKMADQPRYDPLEASDFFEDGMSARPRVAGTVARGEISGNPFFDTGKINGQLANGYPMPVTIEVINRGHERFDIYCAQCHGRVGDGNGMIPARGYRRPPSFHTATLRNATSGHLFDVMTNGFGAMPPYKNQVSTSDRWAIAAYIKALQLSQSATVADVPVTERAKLDGQAGLPVLHQGGHH
jgi:cytochrome c553